MALTGNGSKVIFGGSSFAAELISVNGPSMTRNEIDTTTLATTGGRSNVPSPLYDLGTMDITVEYDGESPIIASTAETITLYFGSTTSTAPNWAFTGWCSNFTPTIGDEERIQADLSLRLTGVGTFSTS